MPEPVEADGIVNQDCVSFLAGAQEPFADLIFADPPFNIGYQYDVYDDRKAYDEYHSWTRQWMGACRSVLKPTGTFWVAIGAEYAAEIRMIGRELGLTLRNWVIWHYTFGQNTKRKFARAHAHLFYFTASPIEFTFNVDAGRSLSDRQREYADKRANPLGKMPFDVWTEFPRVCGTFAEREGWHPCQMPLSILTRIIRLCSSPGDLVFDPFGGSGTTLVAAKRIGRRYLGTELSSDYVAGINRRLADTPTPLDCAEQRWPDVLLDELNTLYLETGLSTDMLMANRDMLNVVTGQFNARAKADGFTDREDYSPEEVWSGLERLRTENRLQKSKVFASETLGGSPRPLSGKQDPAPARKRVRLCERKRRTPSEPAQASSDKGLFETP